MEANQYLELVNSLMKTGASEPVALAIVNEVGKDARVSAMTQRNGNGNGNGSRNGGGFRRSYSPQNGDAPATPKQVGWLRNNGVPFNTSLTKREASRLIDEVKQRAVGQLSPDEE